MQENYHKLEESSSGKKEKKGGGGTHLWTHINEKRTLDNHVGA